MIRVIFLDAWPVSLACDNPGKPDVIRIFQWMGRLLEDGRTQIVLPEIADYEVRRKLLKKPARPGSVRRLDELIKPGGLLIYLPITTAAMRKAANLWARDKDEGQQKASDEAVDGDVILAAQALEYVGETDQLWIATSNKFHLAGYVGERARPWEAITP